ncbi:MAG: trigger factor [Oligosphaeraceae bacterium]
METYKSGLNAELTAIEPCVLQITAVVPAKNGKKTYKDVLTFYTTRVQKKGFRAGHVPQSMIVSLHGKDICEETAQRLLNQAMGELIEAKELQLSGDLEFENDQTPVYTPDQDFTIKATVEVYPQVTLPAYKGLKATRKKVEVEQKRVDEAAETFLRMHGKYEKVDRPAQPGDMLRVDFSTNADDALKEEPRAKYLLTGSNSWQIMREPESIPGITAALTGVALGASKDVEITFPQDFRVDTLAGKTISYHFTIQEVHGFTPPSFDEAFVKETGMKDMEDVKKSMRERMEQQEESSQQAVVAEQVVDAFKAGLDFPLPPKLVSRSLEQALQRMEEKLKSRGLEGEALEKERAQETERIQKDVPTNIRLVHAMDLVAKEEKLTPSGEDIYRYCLNASQSMNIPLDQFISDIRQNYEAWHDMETNLKRQKAVAFLVEHADVTVEGEEKPQEAAPAPAAE